MPLFEYRCESSGHRFEHLVRAGVAPACPKCQGEKLEKQLSVFAVNVPASSGGAGFPADSPCASCGVPGGPAACGMAGHD
jgi:putative FmdB family regulatory protein